MALSGDPATLLAAARDGNRRALARLLTLVEQGGDSAESVVRTVYPATGHAHIVGITGSPGSGKSSLVNEIAKTLRHDDPFVGIIAVDPSSPFSGGAILGDRIRMRDLSGDDGIFIRSMATRGSLGGLARATAAAVKVLDAAGCRTILIETVGAGQSEVDIAGTAHTTLVVEAPGMGDDIQTIKAGILEIADILVLNKADLPGKDATLSALRAMLHLGRSSRVAHHGLARVDDVAPTDADAWEIPLQTTVALDGQGIVELVAAVRGHRDYLKRSGAWQLREEARSRHEIEQLLTARVLDRLRRSVPDAHRDALVLAVARRTLDPYSAVTELVAALSLT